MLTDTRIKATKPAAKPIKLTDSNGLYLEVKPNGSRLWRYRFRIDGKESTASLGEYPQVGLAAAREARKQARALVKEQINPAQHRREQEAVKKAERANTFRAVAEEWIAKKRATNTPYYIKQIESVFASDVYPAVGGKPIQEVSAANILSILQGIEGRGATAVAVNSRQWISAVFRFATATLRANGDPAAALRGAITRRKPKHHRPLSRAEIPAFLRALEGYGGNFQTVVCFKLTMLTFVRPGELRRAKWSEFDLDGALWRVPAERMKKRLPHMVPLSTQAVQLLRELRTLTGGREHLFPNLRRPTDCMSATTLNRALEYLGFNGENTIDFSAHGFRATASTILNECGFRSDVIERQLAHVERNAVRRAYNQAEYLPERVSMMQQWADMIDSLAVGGNVVPLRAA